MEMKIMQPLRRSSNSSYSPLPHNSYPRKHSDPLNDPQQLTRQVQFIRRTIKDHLRQKKYTFQDEKLKQLGNRVSMVRQGLLSIQKQNQDNIGELKTKSQQILKVHQDQISALKLKCLHELQLKQRQYNQKMLAINNQHGRKQQSYKEVIEKLMAALAQAQKVNQGLHLKLGIQMQSIIKVLHGQLAQQKQNKKINRSIRSMVEEITLRQQNSMISSKSGDEMSLQEMDLPPPSHHPQHEERDSCLTEGMNDDCYQKKIQGWLEKLICFGFFGQDNEKLIKKMIFFTKQSQEPTDLLQDKIFPAIVDLLVSNMRCFEQKGWQYLRGASGTHLCDEESRIQLRNVNNLSQLDVNSGYQVSMSENEREQIKRLRHF